MIYEFGLSGVRTREGWKKRWVDGMNKVIRTRAHDAKQATWHADDKASWRRLSKAKRQSVS